MSIKGYFEGVIKNAKQEYEKCAKAKSPRYATIKNSIADILNQLDIAIKFDEISKQDGLFFSNELNKIYNNVCALPELRKKGTR